MSFFQKLTGSFRIQEENNEKSKEQKKKDDEMNTGQDQSDESVAENDEINDNSVEEPTQQEDSSFSESESENDEEEIEKKFDDESENDDEGEDSEKDFLGSGGEFDTEENSLDEDTLDEPKQKTYTIAQLAKVTQKKGLTRKRHFPSIKMTKEEDRKKDDLPTEEPKTPEGQLAIDVYENPNEIIIKSTIAGVKPEDLDVGIEDNTVNIRGSRQNEEKVKTEDYFYQECYWGTFSRSIILPVEIDSEKSTAALKDGILTIRLPKIKKDKEKKIKVLS